MSSPKKIFGGDRSFRSFNPIVLLSAMILLIASSLSACGGSSGGGTPTATINGQVVDKALPGAIVKLYSGNISGTPIATTTADGSGNYSLNFTPSGSTPLFLTATSGTNILASYIGSSNSFSGTVSATSNANLNVTQVSTATLAVVQNQGISLSSLTPTTYGQQIISLENAVIQLAAIVQDIVDQNDTGCSLSTGALTPSNLLSLLGNSSITAATNVISTFRKCKNISVPINKFCSTLRHGEEAYFGTIQPA